MNQTLPANPFEQLILDLAPRYGPGEARSIARIVFEDTFHTRQPAFRVFSPAEEAQFLEIRRRLLLGEPVQYVLESADFFGYRFVVHPAVLIPRQETEELVAWVLAYLKEQKLQAPAVLDIGLGSGCIAVAIKAIQPAVQLYGIEKSRKALALAKANARRILGEGQVTFWQADILDMGAWPPFPLFDVIVSNPPYIPRRERNRVPEHVLAHEPGLALFVEDEDPLLFYRTIGAFSKQKLKPGGAVFFECNEFNATAVVRNRLKTPNER
jgi:release factor glutamine methyltransferase